jgi:diguanylate cyclase (GGDEF)-like protein
LNAVETSSPALDNGSLWGAAVKTTTNLLKIFSFTEFFNSAAANLARLLDADGVALIVYDGPDRLRYKLFYGLDRINQASIVTFNFPSNEGTVGRVLASGQYLFTPDYRNSDDAMPDFVEAGLRSNLVLPLPGPNGFVGAIAIAWINRLAGPLEATNLSIAEMFAALVGSSVYREALERQLKDHSLTDPLTGLPNRRMLMMRLAQAQKRACRNQTLMILAVVDLDGFKAVNDQLGHAVGDQKLLSAATAIRNAVRDIDTVARFGGDEFVVILEDLRSLQEVRAILHRIVQSVDRHVNESPDCYKVTASLGATIYPTDFAEPETLLQHADEAMYLSKRRGGNQFFIALHELEDEAS